MSCQGCEQRRLALLNHIEERTASPVFRFLVFSAVYIAFWVGVFVAARAVFS